MAKSKITSSHSTAVAAAQALVDKLEPLEETSAVSFGVINPCKTVRGNRRVKIMLDSGCYLVKVRDISSVQEIRLYSSAPGYEQLIRDAAVKLGYDVQGDQND